MLAGREQMVMESDGIDYEATFQNFKKGGMVKGTVLNITNKGIIIDIGYKSEGLLVTSEFDNPDSVRPGDIVEVLIEEVEDDEGHVVLSKRKAEKNQSWNRVVLNYKEGDCVAAKVMRKVKGGLMVDIGVEAFLPASLTFLKGFGSLNSLLGQTANVKIIKINQGQRNIIVSRKDLLEKEKQENKSRFISELEIGSIRSGVVKNITDFGAFVNLGGIDGLLHITDISWGRISHPTEVLTVGDKIDVKILQFDKESMKISLGLKQLSLNPWTEVDQKFPIGSRVSGKVVNIVPYGVFVELTKGIEGLVHISELSWSKRVSHPSELFKVGDTVEVMVLSIDKEHEKISLGIRQTEANPWVGIEERYPVGSRVKGVVRGLTEFGAFIEVENGIEGLIHISDMSWTRKINHPKDVLKKGQEVEAMVVMTDQINRKLSLGLKQLITDPWSEIAQKVSSGSLVEGVVTKVASFGVFVEIERDVEGLLHISETDQKAGADLVITYPIGKKVLSRILKVDPAARKIALSVKGIEQPA